jgi:hypothetical protein
MYPIVYLNKYPFNQLLIEWASAITDTLFLLLTCFDEGLL